MSVYGHIGFPFDTGANVLNPPWRLVGDRLETGSGDALVGVRAFEVYSYDGTNWTLLVVMNDYTIALVQGQHDSDQPYAVRVLAAPDAVPLDIKVAGIFVLQCDLGCCKIHCRNEHVWFLSARDPALEWTFEHVSDKLFKWRAADNIRHANDVRMFAFGVLRLQDTHLLRVYGRVPCPLGRYHDVLQLEISIGPTTQPEIILFDKFRHFYFQAFCCITRTNLPAEIQFYICSFMEPNKRILQILKHGYIYFNFARTRWIPML